MSPPQAQSEPVHPSEIAQIRRKLSESFQRLAELISDARRPLPSQTGDGTYIKYEDDSPDLIKKIEAGLKDLSHLGITDIVTLIQVAEKQSSGDLWDDKQYLMERLIQTAVRFPSDSKTGKKVTDGFLSSLWNDLQHPPLSYLGKDYFYRSADGSFNSLLHPALGKANTPYARTVPPKGMQPGALPDPGVIFDSVMTRKHKEPHPNKISSILFYIASIIIHDLFRTDHQNFYNSKTSSYLDLAPLYGSNLDEQMSMRTCKDGKIKPDCFSETRLLSFPPGVGCVLIMFNRFHNHVVEMLQRINQGNQFKRPDGDWPAGDPNGADYPAAWKNLDETLFQTGRLITCGLYINVILLDYVRTILNLNKTNSDWALDPRADIASTPVATGNQVSAEFNLVYRWHSAISERDEDWAWDFWKANFKTKDPETGEDKPMDPATIDWHDFVMIAEKMERGLRAMDPGARPFAGLTRDANGNFDDDKLVGLLSSSIEDVANSFGANRVPPVMRVIEILGIEQARAWNTASLNEFRRYFGLDPHQTFESINPDPYIAEQLKRLYDHPDYVELYPGLVVEEAKKPMIPGAGLAPSFTISRAVLSDAVALVRGDRFYTVDYHPKKLTNWGFSEAATDVAIDHGCVMYKLILNAFPNHFRPDSVYAHYPLTIPSEMEYVLKNLDPPRAHLYNFDKPARKPGVTVVSSYGAVKSILSNLETFQIASADSIVKLLGEPAKVFMLGSTGAVNVANSKKLQDAVYLEGKWEADVRGFYTDMTKRLLNEKGYKLAGANQVDIIRDVGNLAHVHFAAEMFALPLKTEERPLGIFTEHELYLILTTIYIGVFFDVDPVTSYPLRLKTKDATKLLGDLVTANVDEISLTGGLFSRIIQAIFPDPSPLHRDYGSHLLKRLLQAGLPPKQVSLGAVLGTSGGMAAHASQIFAQVVEFYLTTGQDHMPAIQKLAHDESDKAFGTLMRYVLEGARLAGETGAYRHVSADCTMTIDSNGTEKTLQKGERVLLNLRAAGRDAKVFPDPEKVLLDRPMENYAILGLGAHHCLGDRMERVALTAMFKVVAGLEKLRPAKGPQGKVHKVPAPGRPEGKGGEKEPWFHLYLSESHDRLWPFPQSMRVNWG